MKSTAIRHGRIRSTLGAASRSSKKVFASPILLLIPSVVFLLIFLGYPTFEILQRSFTQFNPPEVSGLDNFSWLIGNRANVIVLERTLLTAVLVTAACVLIGYPYAYLATISGRRLRALLLGMVVITAFMSLLVRSYSWLILLGGNGPIADATEAIGLGRVTLAGDTIGVVIAMSQILLPFVILPLYATMLGIDKRITQAGRSLGSGPLATFFRVYLPLSLPGLLAGALLVFVLTLGFYVTPTIVGSAQETLASQLIVVQISSLLAWGRASALAIFLLVATIIGLLIVARAVRRQPEGIVQSASGVSVGDDSSSPHIHRGFRIALIAFASVVLLLLAAPIVVVLILSFTGQESFAFPPESWSTEWYRNFFNDSEWYGSFVRSTVIATVVAVLATILGTTAAMGLVRSRFRGKGVVALFLLTPMLIPLVIVGVGIYAAFLEWKLVGTSVGLITAHIVVALPFVLVPVYTSLRTFDFQLESAAASLGANPMQTFQRVTLPIILPGILAGALFAFLVSFDETVVSLFVTTAEDRTLPVQMFTALTRQTDPTVAAASAMILLGTFLILVLASLIRRKFRHA